MNERGKRRAELFSNPDWLRYITESGGLVERQENRILTSAPFFEKQLRAMLAAGKAAQSAIQLLLCSNWRILYNVSTGLHF